MVPRLVVEQSEGTSELGVFAVLSYVVVAGGLVVTALGQVVTPHLANLHAQGRTADLRRQVCRLTLIGSAIGVLTVVGAVVAGRPLLLVFGPVYADSADVLVLLALVAALGCASLFVGSALHAMGLFAVQAPLQLAVCIVTFVGCVAFTGRWGTRGAALGAIGGALVQALAYGILAWRELRQGSTRAVSRG